MEEKKNEKDKTALLIKIVGYILLGVGIAAAITCIVAIFVISYSIRSIPIFCMSCLLACAGAYLAFRPQQKNKKEIDENKSQKKWD